MSLTATLLLALGFLRAAAPRPRRGVREMLAVLASRRLLARLDDRMLKDIGISRADALAEARRVPWDLGPRG
ncbi:MAG TPA: DUF1127 domain-containing protein [Crenalkalicoccus sp.]|nr:DUF1127 domain-containing protein [Crenalkalicoccus sp.]